MLLLLLPSPSIFPFWQALKTNFSSSLCILVVYVYCICWLAATDEQISLKAVSDSNNNCNIYDDSSSVKAAAGATSGSTTTIQDKDFILELLCWHNEYRQVNPRAA